MSVNVGKAVAYLDIDTSRFKSGLKSASTDLRTFGDSTKGSEARLSGLSNTMKSVGGGMTKYVTVPLTGVGAASLKTAAEFEKQMARVKSISGATGKDFKALEAKAKEMGATTIFTSKDAADAMEYMGMAGWKADQMIAGLPGIMDLAAASGEDLGFVSDIVTDALTGFGLTAKDTSRFVDVLAAASTNSNTNVAMMGETFKYAASVAGALGFSVEDTAIAIGLMANSGIKASQAGTSLRALFTNLAKPVGESKKAVEKLGLSLTDSEGNMKSFKEIMDELRSKFGELKMPQQEVKQKLDELNTAFENGTITEDEYNKSVEELAKNALGAADAEKAKYAAMLAGRTGMSGLLAILNTTTEDYDKLTSAIYGSEGASKEMAETQRDTLWGAMELLKSAINAVAMTIGEQLIPHVRATAEWLTKLVDKFNNLDEKTKAQIVNIGLFVAKIGPALLIGSKVIDLIAKLATSFSTVKKGVDLFLGGIDKLVPTLAKVGGAVKSFGGVLVGFIVAHPVVAAVGAIIAILVTLYAKCEWFRDGVNKIAGFLKDLPGNIVDFFKDLPDKIGGIFEKVRDKIGGAISDTRDKIKRLGDDATLSYSKGVNDNVLKVTHGIHKAHDEIKSKLEEAGDKFGGNLKMGFNSLENAVEGSRDIAIASVDIIGDTFDGVGSMIINAVTLDFDGVALEWKVLCERIADEFHWIEDGWKKVKDGIGGFGHFLKKEVSDKFSDLKKSVADNFNVIKDNIKDTFENSKIGGFFKDAGEKFEELKKSGGEKLKELRDSISGINKDLSESLPDNFQNFFTEKISGFFGGIVDKAKEAGQSTRDFFSKSPEEMGYAVGQMAGNIVIFFADAGNKIMTFVTETIPEKWSQFSEWFATNIGGFFDNIGENITKIGENIADFFKGIPEKISGIFDNLGELYEKFNEWCGEMAGKLGEWLGSLAGNIYLFFTETIPNAWHDFWSKIPEVLNSIGEFFADIWEKIKDFFDNAWDKLETWAKNLDKKLSELAMKLFNWVITEIPKIIGKIVDFFKELPKKIKDFVDKAWDHFRDWAKKMVDKAAETGKKVVDSVIKFLKELPGKIWDAIKKAYTKVKEWGKNMWDAAKDIGRNFVKNLVDFFKELPGKIWDWIKKIPEKIKLEKDTFSKAGKALLDGLWSGLKGTWDKIWKWLGDIWGNVQDFFAGFKKGFDDTVNSKSVRSINGSHAGGLSYVPFDGYVAELHKGERVLTEDENRRYSQGNEGYTGGGDVFNFYNTTQDPYEYYREVKKAKRELAFGF